MLCAAAPAWLESPPPDALIASLAAAFPRLAVTAQGLLWIDVHGLDAAAQAERLAAVLQEHASESCGIGGADVPVVAEAAARHALATGAGMLLVASSAEREFLATLPLTVLAPDAALAALLDGVGIDRCGGLAALAGEAVEVRFGAPGRALWRRARADDPRLLFRPMPPERPHASLDFIDYVVTDPARLLFTANALLGPLCERMHARGEHASRITLALALANGEDWRRPLRSARPTADRDRWLRLLRATLERLSVPDAVAGMRLEIAATESAIVQQGDLFDAGFATASAFDAAVARLIETHGEVVVTPEVNRHPLPERATRWRPATNHQPSTTNRKGGAAGPMLTLQLLREPRRVEVECTVRGGYEVPVRYRERSDWCELVSVAGPDRISGGHWDAPYAREYYRCISTTGVLLWLFHDARDSAWWLHGWWD